MAILDIISLLILIAGGIILGIWLIVYSGPAALKNAPARRNNLHFILPFLLISIWLVFSAAAVGIITLVLENTSAQHYSEKIHVEQPVELVSSLAMMAIEVVLIVAILILAKTSFARGLKGLGLSPKTIARDLPAAAVNLLAVYPLVTVMVVLVMYLGQFFGGDGFQMQVNEGLLIISESTSPFITILLLFCFAVIVSIFEEVLFRGILQSMIRGYLGKPWPAILITSFLFALMHPWMHWPAIFALSLGFGYAYERSGSLLRPIFMHIIFNSVSIITLLLTEIPQA